MSMMKWCLIFTLVPLAICNQATFTITTNQVIYTLQRALQFFALHIDEVNLDAGIGTRIAADQLRPYIRCKHCKLVKDIADLSEYVTWKIGESVRYRQPDYYKQLSFLLMPGTFSYIVPFRSHNNKYQINTEKECSSSPFIEKHSDQCLQALVLNRCNVTESCVKLMSDPFACRYSLTHQVLYSVVAKKSSCNHQQLSLRIEYQMVSKMLNESQAIADAQFSESDRDLFMEQMALGGLLGWNEFFQDASWIDSIINWQHPIEGCYGNDTNHINKREEMIMLHQCLSHRTSVAIAALSQILRYLLSRDI